MELVTFLKLLGSKHARTYIHTQAYGRGKDLSFSSVVFMCRIFKTSENSSCKTLTVPHIHSQSCYHYVAQAGKNLLFSKHLACYYLTRNGICQLAATVKGTLRATDNPFYPNYTFK